MTRTGKRNTGGTTARHKAFALFIVLLFLFIYLPLTVQPVGAVTWWDNGWTYCKSHIINQTSGADVNYPILFNVTYGSGTDTNTTVFCSSHCRTDFGDLRFIASDNTTVLNYWLVNYTNYALVWVNVTGNLTAGAVTIEMYYGNAGVTTTSNFDSVFIFGDPFNNATLNSTRWPTVTGNPTYTIDATNHYLSLTSMDDQWRNGYGFKSLSLTFPSQWMVDDPYNNSNGYLEYIEAGANNLGYFSHAVANSSGWGSTNIGIVFTSAEDAWATPNQLEVDAGSETSQYSSGILSQSILTIYAKMWKVGGNVYASTNGTQRINVTNADTPSNFWLEISKLASYTESLCHFGAFCVRKYTNPEPQQWTWSAEGTSSDTTPPTYTTIGQNSTLAGNSSLFYTLWADNVALSGWIVGTNNSGAWVNSSWAAFSGSWANYTITLNSTVGDTIQWKCYANDSSNNWNGTSVQSFNTTQNLFSWWDTGWNYRTNLSFYDYNRTGISSYVFQLHVFNQTWRNQNWTLDSYNELTLPNSTSWNSSFSDLRFIYNGSELLYNTIKVTSGQDAIFDINFANYSTNLNYSIVNFTVYWGNPSAADNSSTSFYTFFDNFTSSWTTNWNSWKDFNYYANITQDTTGQGTVYINSYNATGNQAQYAGLQSKQNFSFINQQVIIRAIMTDPDSNESNPNAGAFGTSIDLIMAGTKIWQNPSYMIGISLLNVTNLYGYEYIYDSNGATTSIGKNSSYHITKLGYANIAGTGNSSLIGFWTFSSQGSDELLEPYAGAQLEATLTNQSIYLAVGQNDTNAQTSVDYVKVMPIDFELRNYNGFNAYEPFIFANWTHYYENYTTSNWTVYTLTIQTPYGNNTVYSNATLSAGSWDDNNFILQFNDTGNGQGSSALTATGTFIWITTNYGWWLPIRYVLVNGSLWPSWSYDGNTQYIWINGITGQSQISVYFTKQGGGTGGGTPPGPTPPWGPISFPPITIATLPFYAALGAMLLGLIWLMATTGRTRKEWHGPNMLAPARLRIRPQAARSFAVSRREVPPQKAEAPERSPMHTPSGTSGKMKVNGNHNGTMKISGTNERMRVEKKKIRWKGGS